MAETSSLESKNFVGDPDVHITYEDQQKINKFARCNARLEDIKEELKHKENDLQNVEDASHEMWLLDKENKVHFMVGEVFIMKTQEEASETIVQQISQLEEDKITLSKKAEELQAIMSRLKVDLYAKFGNNINLEADDD